MGRFRDAAGEDGNEPGIDMSPLIDCVFILLIFFIVTTVFVEETGVDVDKPQAASSRQLEKNSILIALTNKGEVIYGKREIGLSGVRPLVKRIIRKEVVPVIIQVDTDSRSGLLVRIIDAPLEYRREVEALAERHGFTLPRPPGPEIDTQLAAAIAEAAQLIEEHPR